MVLAGVFLYSFANAALQTGSAMSLAPHHSDVTSHNYSSTHEAKGRTAREVVKQMYWSLEICLSPNVCC